MIKDNVMKFLLFISSICGIICFISVIIVKFYEISNAAMIIVGVSSAIIGVLCAGVFVFLSLRDVDDDDCDNNAV